MEMFLLPIWMLFVSIHTSSAERERFSQSQSSRQLRTLIELLIDEVADNSQCIVSITDTYYRRKVDISQIVAKNALPMYRVLVRENEEFSPPRKRLIHILHESNYAGCDVYLVLMTNGLQVANFLRYTEEERLINTQGKFILIYDFRIFKSDMRYLWNRIINVIFLRHYVEFKRRSDRRLRKREWYDLNTVPFPAKTKGLVVTNYVDTWYQNRFRYGIYHFFTKTQNLRQQELRVAVLEHIPAVTEDAKNFFENLDGIAMNSKPLGIEFELLLVIAKVLNFKPDFYMPENIQNDRWGYYGKNESFTGLFGEAKEGKAVFYLGDIHYTMPHLQILDLSWPYNTECLTFLTLESLTENSWKLLILPFTLYTWIALFLTLLLGGFIFYILSNGYKKYVDFHEEVVPTQNKSLSKRIVVPDELRGLYLFTGEQNSILYTYSMLLQVSLPTLPTCWSVRIFIGWWWIFTILITVTYKASMTVSLVNSVKRVTIDTIPQLVKSTSAVGSWSEETRDFFINSSDPYLQKLSQRYIVISNEQDAIAAVSNGTLCYYENIYILQRQRVDRQILEDELQKNGTNNNEHKVMDHNLHIMEECVINVPISVGMDKNSPLKNHVNKLVKRILEAGFVEKWLSDITQQSKVLELRQEGGGRKAIIDLNKLQGAMVALGIGYFCGSIALGAEIWHWKHIVLKDPNFNRYRQELFYKRI